MSPSNLSTIGCWRHLKSRTFWLWDSQTCCLHTIKVLSGQVPTLLRAGPVAFTDQPQISHIHLNSEQILLQIPPRDSSITSLTRLCFWKAMCTGAPGIRSFEVCSHEINFAQALAHLSANSESAGRQKGQRLRSNQFLNRSDYTTSAFLSLPYPSNLILPQESSWEDSDSPVCFPNWLPDLTVTVTLQMMLDGNDGSFEEDTEVDSRLWSQVSQGSKSQLCNTVSV